MVILDYENTIIDGDGSATNQANDLVLYSWYVKRPGSIETKSVIGGVYSQEELFQDLRECDFLVAHNAKHELQWLHRGGYPIQDLLVYDTMLAQRVIDGNRRRPLGLDPVARKYGYPGKCGPINRMFKLGVCPSSMPTRALKKYNLSDIYNTYGIWQGQLPVLEELGLLGVVMTRCILTPFLAQLEFVGNKLDDKRVIETYKEALSAYTDVTQTLIHEFGDINYNSGKQVAQLVYERLGFDELKDNRGNPLRNKPTKTFPEGAPLTDKDTLMALKPRNKKQRRFLELKLEQGKHNAILTKTLVPFKRCVEESADQILRFSYNQHIAGTHRLSSNGTEFGVQGQNMANKFKRLIKSRKDDWLLFEADYSKLEFNVASVLGNDKVAQHEVVTGFDVHKYSAAVMKVADEHIARKQLDIGMVMEEAVGRLDEITKEERRLAKPDTFGPLYGKTKGTPAQEAYFEAFKLKYKDLTATQERWIGEVLNDPDRCLRVAANGMRFYFPAARITRTGWIEENTKIRNYPIQSFATADIVPIGVVYAWQLTLRAGLQAFFINTVHDSCIGEVHKSVAKELGEILQFGMVDCVHNYLKEVYNFDYPIPLEIEYSYGWHWSEPIGENE